MGKVIRPTEPLEGVKHGTAGGYDRGCGCFPCRAANRDRTNNYREKKRLNADKPLKDSAKVPAEAGQFEADVIRWIADLGATGHEAKLVQDMMLFNARLLDDIPRTERWHLANSTQKTLLELKAQLQRIAGVAEAPGGKGKGDASSDLAGFLSGLATQG